MAPSNLPLSLNTFVGRADDMARVRKQLGGSRLVTLTGPPGIGKSRLALEVAAELVAEHSDGSWLAGGGPACQAGSAIAVDRSGMAYIVGYTAHGRFPTTPGAYRSTNSGPPCRGLDDVEGCYDAFVAKFDPGSVGAASLLYSTYLGGSHNDRGYGIALDPTRPGVVYVTGLTRSEDFPTTFGACSPAAPTALACKRGDSDAFVAQLNTIVDGSSIPAIPSPGAGVPSAPTPTVPGSLLSSMYLGGSDDVFPTGGPGGNDGSPAPWASQYLKDEERNNWVLGEFGKGVATDATDGRGDAYVVGMTNASAGLVQGTVVQNTKGSATGVGRDAFVARVGSILPPLVREVLEPRGKMAGGYPVTLRGERFRGATSVKFGDREAPLVCDGCSVSDTEIRTKVPEHAPSASDVAVDVSVTAEGVTSQITEATRFTYLARPVVERIDPGEGLSSGEDNVVLSAPAGTGFDGVSEVAFGDARVAIPSASGATLAAKSPPHDPGPVRLSVTSALRGDSDPSQPQFVFRPALRVLSPPSGDTKGGEPVRIVGRGLDHATSVTFDDRPAQIVSISPGAGPGADDQIELKTPAHPAGNALVTVATVEPDGVTMLSLPVTKGASNVFSFVLAAVSGGIEDGAPPGGRPDDPARVDPRAGGGNPAGGPAAGPGPGAQPVPGAQPTPVAQSAPGAQPVPGAQPGPVAQPVPGAQPAPAAQPGPASGAQPIPAGQAAPAAPLAPSPPAQPVGVAQPAPLGVQPPPPGVAQAVPAPVVQPAPVAQPAPGPVVQPAPVAQPAPLVTPAPAPVVQPVSGGYVVGPASQAPVPGAVIGATGSTPPAAAAAGAMAVEGADPGEGGEAGPAQAEYAMVRADPAAAADRQLALLTITGVVALLGCMVLFSRAVRRPDVAAEAGPALARAW